MQIHTNNFQIYTKQIPNFAFPNAHFQIILYFRCFFGFFITLVVSVRVLDHTSFKTSMQSYLEVGMYGLQTEASDIFGGLLWTRTVTFSVSCAKAKMLF